MKALKLFLVTSLCALAVVGCESQNSVGSQSLEIFTPPPSPHALPSPSPSALQQGGSTRPSPVAQRSTAPPTVTVTVTIEPDSSSTNPNPQSITVTAGTIVKWVNADSVARGVQGGPFKSPLIQPGQSWTYTFSSPGTYDYQDETRPYVTGEVVVR